MSSFVKQIIKRSCGGRWGQEALQWLVVRMEGLMGIGSGACVESSGELQVLKSLRHSTSTALTILDVGANVGDFSSAALQIINNKPLVIHAFEPGRVPFAAMSARLAKHSNIYLNHSALSSQEGTAILHYDYEGSGGASLSKRDCRHLASKQPKSESVILTTLAKYCSQNRVGFVDLIKMDVEGHELEVLKGGAEIFAAGKVGMCLFEFGGANIDSRTFFRDLFYFFAEKGYDVLRVTPAPSLVPLPKYQEFYEQFRTTNFLAVKRDNAIRKPIE